jgi:hypothetical protein
MAMNGATGSRRQARTAIIREVERGSIRARQIDAGDEQGFISGIR